MSYIPKPNEIYKHFKGNLYRIIAVAEHSETGEQLVIYQAMYEEGKIYARELSMFTSPVDKEKYPNAVQKYRFELQGDDKQETEAVTETEPALDPEVLEFLDADTYEQRLNILAGLHYRITDEMITTMAIACDIEVKDGPLEDRFSELKNCLLTLDKYEGNRLR